ncbi:MAG TPA: hypothetical protein VGF67_17665 [Ktedonobacteraceae bacterium]|jgi:hypothetical protein
MIDSQEIEPGDIVFYVLRGKDKPAEPARKWKGQVVRISRYYATVRVLEEGYEQEEETIFVKQIVQVEKENHRHQPGDSNSE